MKRNMYKFVVVFTFLLVGTTLTNISLHAQQNLFEGNWIIQTAEVSDYDSTNTLLTKSNFTYGVTTSGVPDWVIMGLMLSDTYWSIGFSNVGLKGDSYQIQPVNINFYERGKEEFSFSYIFQGNETIVVEYEALIFINNKSIKRKIKETLNKEI